MTSSIIRQKENVNFDGLVGFQENESVIDLVQPFRRCENRNNPEEMMLIELLIYFYLIRLTMAQKVGGNKPIVVPTDSEAQFPELITSDNFPLFPFTDQFNTGFEVNPANKVSLAGDLNIPVPGWGNWDMDLNFYSGNINTDGKVGYQIHPTNPLGIKPETLALLNQNPAFRKARRKAKTVSLGRFPYGYEPKRCKPPYCNPFVHHTAVGVEFEQGDDSFFIGGVDFPLPVGTAGAGIRFPLSGAVEQGTSPYAYAHGHAFNPSSAFDFTKIDGVRRKPSKSPIPMPSFDMNSSKVRRKPSNHAGLFNSDSKSQKSKNPSDFEKLFMQSLNLKSLTFVSKDAKSREKFKKEDQDFVGSRKSANVMDESKNKRAKSARKKVVPKDDPLSASNIKFDIFS